MPKYLPWMQFEVDKWLGDEQLSLCHPATRGVWIDAICLMHKAGREGVLRETVEALAQVCRCTPEAMEESLRELRRRKVADVAKNKDGTWTLVNRKMAKDAGRKRREKDRVAKHRGSKLSRSSTHSVRGGADSPELFDGSDVAATPTVDVRAVYAPGNAPGTPSVTPERLRVKELTTTALAKFASETSGFGGGGGAIAVALERHGEQAVIDALEFRAEIGAKAFDGAANPVALLMADCRNERKAEKPGAFKRWLRTQSKRRESDERQQMARAFARRTKAERAELTRRFIDAGHALTQGERLSEAASEHLQILIGPDFSEPLAVEAVCLERFARTQGVSP